MLQAIVIKKEAFKSKDINIDSQVIDIKRWEK